MAAITMRQAAKEVGFPYSTVARWVQEGVIRAQRYTGIRGSPVRLSEKQMRELRILAQLRGVLSMQALKKALRYLREDLKQNPLSTGRFFVVGGPPQSRRLIKICDSGEAIELIGKDRGQLMVPLLFDEIESKEK